MCGIGCRGRGSAGSHYGEPEQVAATVAQITAAGGRALAYYYYYYYYYYEADQRNAEAKRALVARAVEAFGRLDIFAANAGLTLEAPFLDTDEALWDTVVDLNPKGSYFGAQAAARQMIAQGQGDGSCSPRPSRASRACRPMASPSGRMGRFALT
jgi:3-oxoacyl-[acyl-carrier protein] reductase